MSATFDGYLLHRVLEVDEAIANGDYAAAWVDISFELEPGVAATVRTLADSLAVEPEDLVMAWTMHYLDQVPGEDKRL